MRRSIDLHLHSNLSDGELSPAELVHLLGRKKIELIALTDHDTVAGIPEAISAALEYPIKLLPGVEISTSYRGGEVHILGFFSAIPNGDFQIFLQKRFQDREERVGEMIEKLQQIGVHIDYQQVLDQSPGPYVGRPNVAKAMVQNGYVMSIEEAFSGLYIGNHGKAYVSPKECSPMEAIKQIRKAGGKSFIAHPGIYYSPRYPEGLSEKDYALWIEAGLDGIEVFHPKQSQEMTRKLLHLAKKRSLALSIGSDYHYGEYRPFYDTIAPQYLEDTWKWFVSEIP